MISVDDIEGEGPGGAVRFVRRQLGVEAFGSNRVAGEDVPVAVGARRGSYEPRGPF